MATEISDSDITQFLPVRPIAFAVLAGLAEAPLPGIDVLERVNETRPSAPLLGVGSLYRLLRELRRAGWITRTDAPEGSSTREDERRQYHELTSLGRRILEAEAARLRHTMAIGGLIDPNSSRSA